MQNMTDSNEILGNSLFILINFTFIKFIFMFEWFSLFVLSIFLGLEVYEEVEFIEESDKENVDTINLDGEFDSNFDGDGRQKDEDLIFVKLLKEHGQSLLDKSQNPSLKLKKKTATGKISSELATLGIHVSQARVKKKYENLKARLKKKNRFEANRESSNRFEGP